jgi:broad specificity phosphatase PhoE
MMGGVMKTVELRRNSQWTRTSATLSEAGARLVDLARPQLGGPYHAYYSSPSRRCRATMRALGHATFARSDKFGRLPRWFNRFQSGLEAGDGRSGTPFLEGYLAHPEARQRLLRRGAGVLDAVRKVARRLPDEGRALVITHLLTIELVAMVARNDENPALIGRELSPLEGVAMELEDDGRVIAVRELRLPDAVLAALES